MGEAKRRESATAKLIAKFPHCALCAGLRCASTRDHIPPVALFDGRHRPDKIVVPACQECNGTTSTADLVASIVSRWRYEPIPQELSDHSGLVRRLRKQAPEIYEEWTNSGVDRERGRKHLLEQGVHVPDDAGLISIGARTIRELNLFAHKLALGLYFEHFTAPLPMEGRFCAFWRSKEDYQQQRFPRQVLAMMPDHEFLRQGAWHTQETFEYRSGINAEEGAFAFAARLRAGLFVVGFALRDGRTAPSDDDGWISPSGLLGILQQNRFKRRR